MLFLFLKDITAKANIHSQLEQTNLEAGRSRGVRVTFLHRERHPEAPRPKAVEGTFMNRVQSARRALWTRFMNVPSTAFGLVTAKT